MKEKRWILKEQPQQEIDALCRAFDISSVTARLLINRGLHTPQQTKEFLNKSLDQLGDPFGLQDMDKAVARIREALKNGEKITIYGDYDVDGITSTTILYQFLTKEGGTADYYIPDRVEEGYGVNLSAIDTIAASGTKLLVTVDSGITACDEMRYACGLGLDVIVTDHHECSGELPSAAAVVDTKRPDSRYPFKNLAGVGVVFKLICALAGPERLNEMIDAYSELVAIGTTADVMPLTGENRVLVSLGLKRLENTKSLGLKALISAAGVDKKKITSSVIGYTLAPRINAIGRVGCAKRAVDLLLAKTEAEAAAAAADLCDANRLRQEEENKLLTEAYAMIEEDRQILSNKIIVLSNDTWHHGIIGIASSRINEKYGLPAILITFDGDMGKGSCRSSKSPFNIYDALDQMKHYFEKFGGHMSAAGFSIRRDRVEDFKRDLIRYVNESISDEELCPKLEIDCDIPFEDISFKTIREISLLEPYGTENPAPLFLIREVKITEITPLSGDKHTRFTITDGKHTLSAFYFGMPSADLKFYCGNTVDLVFNLDINVYRGEITPQVTVRDIKQSEMERAWQEKQLDILCRYVAREELTGEELSEIIPRKEDFIAVFRFARGLKSDLSLTEMASRIVQAADERFSIGKLKVCLDVFMEMGIIQIDGVGADFNRPVSVRLIPTNEKKDLNKSEVLCMLKKKRAGIKLHTI